MRPALLDRLVQDAESLAGTGERSAALALLRWAATACAPDALPAVLLAYHRIRQAAAAIAAGERMETDALGFPTPRFARRAPEPDLRAFVPSPRFTGERGLGPAVAGPPPVAAGRASPRKRWRRPMAAIAGAGLAAGALPGHGGGAAASAAATVAIHLGAPELALQLAAHADPADPRTRLIRARALLSAADTGGAAAELIRVAGAPAAEAEVVADGARELARLPGHGADAAEAYLAAVRLGLAEERWSEAEAALERGGRAAEAARLRALRQHTARP